MRIIGSDIVPTKTNLIYLVMENARFNRKRAYEYIGKC